MRIRTSLGPWTAAFFATLGLTPLVACGGTTLTRSGENQNEAGGGAGLPGAGGAGAGGVIGGTGGTVIWEGVGGTWSAGGSFPGGSGNVGGTWQGTGGEWPMGGTAGFLPCRNPTPRVGVDGKATGIVDCAGGSMVRVEPRDCGSVLPRAEACPSAQVFDGGYGCARDSDCKDAPNGYCNAAGGGQMPGCYCSYGCVRDSDCTAGNICVCGDPVGQCMPSTCAGPGDCTGGLCLSYTFDPGCGGTGFACQGYGDTCVSDADCSAGAVCGLVNGLHTCQGITCAVGRPFLVGGAALVAGVARRGDWTSSLSPCLDGLDADARRALAARWTEIALMEQASIAAFARFALETMSLGAPPELLVATHAAMADETVHARDAFALASAYGGTPVGPGKLDVGAALASRSPLDIVRTTILEGCIGETVAAVEAAEALAHATDPAVREALARVTVDETQHAELAWRFVQWVLSDGDAELAAETATELVAVVEGQIAATRRGDGARRAASNPALLAHGVVSEDTREEIRRRVLSEIVLPCARALAARGLRRGATGRDASVAA